MQLVRNSNTLLITASSTLQTVLDGKQSIITVGGDDVSSFKLLKPIGLASIGSSDTVVPVVSTNADGTPLIVFNSTLDVGSLTGYAPTANPAFTGTASFVNVSSITRMVRLDNSLKDFGLAEYINTQLSFYGPKQNPVFKGSATAPLFNATNSIAITGNTVPTALQISNTLTSYLTSSGATSLYQRTVSMTSYITDNTLSCYLTSSGATHLYATKNNPVFTCVVSTSAISATSRIDCIMVVVQSE